MKPAILPLFPSLALASSLLTGCGGLKQTATVSSPVQTKFLTSTKADLSDRSGRLPFDHSWYAPKVDLSKYKNIVVRPITTEYLRTEKWEDSKSPAIANKSAYIRRCNALASYWNKSLTKSFSSPLCVFYKTTDTSQPGTLVLEIALTEVRFDRPETKNGKPENPAGGVVSAVAGPPSCAFESRTRDAATGKIVATAADRRGPELKVIPDEKKHALAKPNEDICDEWSKQLMERWNPEIYPRVKRQWFSFF